MPRKITYALFEDFGMDDRALGWQIRRAFPGKAVIYAYGRFGDPQLGTALDSNGEALMKYFSNGHDALLMTIKRDEERVRRILEGYELVRLKNY